MMMMANMHRENNVNEYVVAIGVRDVCMDGSAARRR